MYVCMYVCMYVHVCMYVCLCMYVDVCMYVCIHVRMYVCIHVRMYVCYIAISNQMNQVRGVQPFKTIRTLPIEIRTFVVTISNQIRKFQI